MYVGLQQHSSHVQSACFTQLLRCSCLHKVAALLVDRFSTIHLIFCTHSTGSTLYLQLGLPLLLPAMWYCQDFGVWTMYVVQL